MTSIRRPVDPRSSSATPQQVAAFLEAAFGSFERAYQEHGATDDLCVAGRPVRIRYAAPQLRDRFRPTLRHLEVPAGRRPVLAISCWDGTATREQLPPPPWRQIDFVGGSRIRGHIVGPIVATYDADGRLFQLLDRPGRRALFHVGSGRDLPDWHDRSPFRPFVSLWADDERLALLHGAAVAEHGSAVVLAGQSGSGKSTTALACLAAGMDFLADDACLVDPVAGTVASIYGRAKLEPDATARIGRLPHAVLGTDERGATVIAPRTVARNAALRAILLVAVSGRPATELSTPLPRAVALDALADTLRAENSGITPATFAALEATVDAFPVRRLAVGTDRAATVSAMRRLLVR